MRDRCRLALIALSILNIVSTLGTLVIMAIRWIAFYPLGGCGRAVDLATIGS